MQKYRAQTERFSWENNHQALVWGNSINRVMMSARWTVGRRGVGGGWPPSLLDSGGFSSFGPGRAAREGGTHSAASGKVEKDYCTIYSTTQSVISAALVCQDP